MSYQYQYAKPHVSVQEQNLNDPLKTYSLSNQDQLYLEYFEKKYLLGQNINYPGNSWFYKQKRDFRYLVYQLLDKFRTKIWDLQEFNKNNKTSKEDFNINLIIDYLDKVNSGDLFESWMKKYQSFIDKKTYQNFQRLRFKQVKEKECLVSIRIKLNEMEKKIGEFSSTDNDLILNPNVIDYYTQMNQSVDRIFSFVNKVSAQQVQTDIKIIRSNAIGVKNVIKLGGNISCKTTEEQTKNEILLYEQNLKQQIEDYDKLKKQLINVLTNFEEQFKRYMKTWRTGGDYQITKQNFKKLMDNMKMKLQTYEQSSQNKYNFETRMTSNQFKEPERDLMNSQSQVKSSNNQLEIIKQNQKIRQQLQTIKNELANLKCANSDLQNQYNQYEVNQKKFKENEVRLKRIIDQNTRVVNEKQVSLQIYSKNNLQLKQSEQQLIKQLQGLKVYSNGCGDRIEELMRINAQLQTEIKKMKQESQRNNQQNHSFQTSLNYFQRRVNELEQILQNNNIQFQKQKQKLLKVNSHQQTLIKQNGDQIHQLKQLISQLTSNIAARLVQTQEHKDKINQLQLKRTQMQVQSQLQLNQLSKTKDHQISQHKAVISANQQKVNLLETQIKKQQKDNFNNQTLIKDLQWRVSDLTKQLKLKFQECDQLAGFTTPKTKTKPKISHVQTQTQSTQQQQKQQDNQQLQTQNISIVISQDVAQSDKIAQSENVVLKNNYAQSNNVVQSNKIAQSDKIKQSNNAQMNKKAQTFDVIPGRIDQQSKTHEQNQQVTKQVENEYKQRQCMDKEKQQPAANISQMMALNKQQFQFCQQTQSDMSSMNQSKQQCIFLTQQIEKSMNVSFTQTHLSPIDLSRLKQQIRQKQLIIETSQKNIQTLQKDNIGLKDIVDKFILQLSNLNCLLGQTQSELVSTRNELNIVNSQTISLTQDTSKLFNDLQQIKNQSTTQQTSLNQQIQQLNTTNSELNQQIQSLSAQNSLLTQDTNKKQKLINQSQNKITQFTHQIAQFTHQVQQLNTTISSLNQQTTTKSNLIKQLEDKITQLQKQKQNYAPQMENLKDQKLNYQSQNQQLRQKITLINSQKDQLKRNIKTQKQQQQNKKKQHLQEIRKTIIQGSLKVKEINRQKSSLEYELRRIKMNGGSNNTSSSGSTSQLQMQNEKLRKDLQKLNAQIKSYDSETIQLKQKKKQLQKQLKQKTSKIQDLQLNLNATNLTLNQLIQQSSTSNSDKLTQTTISKYIMFDRLFAGQILQDEHQKKYLLSNAIEKKLHAKINKTKLLYKFDLLNTSSFHNYIDGKNNLLIVVRTINGKIFGSFSTQKYQAKSKQSHSVESFLFSFNPETKEPISCFTLNRSVDKAKSLTYDQYFLIVGNSEIRWKMGENTIYSNFGIINAFYEPRGTNVSALLQVGEERQTQIKGFQCFQVCFEQ